MCGRASTWAPRLGNSRDASEVLLLLTWRCPLPRPAPLLPIFIASWSGTALPLPLYGAWSAHTASMKCNVHRISEPCLPASAVPARCVRRHAAAASARCSGAWLALGSLAIAWQQRFRSFPPSRRHAADAGRGGGGAGGAHGARARRLPGPGPRQRRDPRAGASHATAHALRAACLVADALAARHPELVLPAADAPGVL
jgi:hypothetical protein